MASSGGGGEVKEPGLQPVSVELPEGPPQEGISQDPPPSSGMESTAAESTAAPGDHGEPAKLPVTVRPAAVEEDGGVAEEEGPGEEGVASLSGVVVEEIMSQPRIITDGNVCTRRKAKG